MVQKMVNGKRAWDYASVSDDEFKTNIEEEKQGWSWSDIEKYASDVVTVCRRKFKKQDIILCALLDSYNERMTGIVFLKDKLF